MTKQEIYDALIAKFDNVLPLGEWQKRNAVVLGVSAYELQAYKRGDVPRDFTLYVEEDETASEYAFFVGKNPLAEVSTDIPFIQRVKDEIEARKVAEQIVDAFIKQEAIGDSVCEVVAYKDSGSDLTREEYVIYDDSGTLQFKKLV